MSPSATAPRTMQRLRTRARVFQAAVAEIGRSGLADADVGAIVAAAGVARGTFYFHFPTKEHVLAELERNEEIRIVAKLGTRGSEAGDLRSLLALLVRHVLAAERRVGATLFRDMLALHFAPTRPVEDVGDHPLATFVITAIERAKASGQVSRQADAIELGVIFLTGLFGLLARGGSRTRARAALLDRYVTMIVHGMEAK